MKTHRALTPQQKTAAETDLYKAILTLTTTKDCRRFFRDLCTPAELEAMIDRWMVVGLLEKEEPYRRIHDKTGVSVTTIGRVARYLGSGNGGYALALERLGRRVQTA